MSKQHRTIVFVGLKKKENSSIELKAYKRSDYNINTVDVSANKPSVSFHCAATRSYKYRGGNLLILSHQQGPPFTSVKQSETCN